MWITEYNEEMSHAMFRQQGYDEGVAVGEARGEARGEAKGEARGEARGINIGKEQGLIEGIARLVKSGVITLSQGAEQLEMPESKFAQKAAELGIDVY